MLGSRFDRSAFTRRELLRASLAGAGGLGLAVFAGCGGDDDELEPVVPFTGTLRVLGLGVELNETIRREAERNLGFNITFEILDSVEVVRQVITQPASFDVFSGSVAQIEQIWPSGSLVGIDRGRVRFWDNVGDLYKLGVLAGSDGSCSPGDGDAPFRKMYSTLVHEPGELTIWGAEDGGRPASGTPEPEALSFVPTTLGLDSIGYNADVVALAPDEVSWGELFNPSWRGRVALMNDPTVALQDAAAAASALGLIEVGDVGNMTQEEIDPLVEILLALKADGQFHSFWTTFEESVDLMASGEVAIEPMWPPAAVALSSDGFPARYAAPVEGFRGWCLGQALSKGTLLDESLLRGCYDYVNWWHSGEPGAIMMRQGYYNAVQETSREFVEPGEYAYWVEGEPADQDFPGPFGDRSVAAGQLRDGGSFAQRACRFASWVSFFNDEHEYALERWDELLEA